MNAPAGLAQGTVAAHLGSIDTALLDCVTDDLALLLAHAGVENVPEVLGHRWELRLATRAGVPRVELPAPERDDVVAEMTGLRPTWRHGPATTGSAVGAAATVDAWRDELAAGRPVLVVADAYHLPWVPYHGHEHMDHGYVVERIDGGRSGATLRIVDPYDNVTPYGRARPTTAVADAGGPAATTTVAWATLQPSGAPARALDVPGRLRRNARQILDAEAGQARDQLVTGETDTDPSAVENLALQTWLLTRDRALHARWLAHLDPVGDTARWTALVTAFADEIVPAWHRAAEMTYLAQRRARAGKRVPSAGRDAVSAVLAVEARCAHQLHEITDNLGGTT